MPDVSYTYAEAVAEGICRPVAFVTFDGTLSWRSGEDVVESSFETVLSAREASRRYRTAISTDLPEGLPRILREANAKLGALRAAGHGDAGGLAVAADATHARRIAKLLGETTGRAPVVVLHTEAQRRAQARGLPRLARAVDGGGEHGLRGRGHPAAARGGICDGRQDAADLPPDRRAVRAHDPDRSKIGQRSRAELAVPARRSHPACTCLGSRNRAAPRPPPRRARGGLGGAVQRRASEPSPPRSSCP